ncbi:MAG: hypothetical protein NC206_08185, partial [Bacteroides sp.]|nr:hypothetical protein [Roseburia sp.]MCM1347047.1 hypothetical protein [Bacteroides sp.]MCM1421729.1 hypothetical protein [Bacteroides sp.]
LLSCNMCGRMVRAFVFSVYKVCTRDASDMETLQYIGKGYTYSMSYHSKCRMSQSYYKMLYDVYQESDMNMKCR